ncbi:MAG: hypothetical protein RM347_009110 [Nostoc sp. ChiQUE02]|uniref:hypothetical protein n=1 Tax=Nostoc sp. ChiQUE02 TaxID=3075377 RepID=UPI002AD34850|nr:hypothetical protein [Nostoc sp. ChiQUE02]MDZ8232892.1 hypothetical protein [Nostoc sp. ChiQUE02]
MANWYLNGELTVSNSWQLFPNDVIADTFRITTSIQNLDDWEKWKFKSAAYLRFFYADNSASPNYYIRVRDVVTIYQFSVPVDLKNQGYLIRTAAVIRASRYLPFTPNQNFAQWSLKLESFQ